MTRKEALLLVDRAMVRIRRSQGRRTVGKLMQRKVGARINLANIAVADALEELADDGVENPSIGEMAERLGIEPSRASRMTASAIRAGFVRRIASQLDGRLSRLTLTSEGRKALRMTREFRVAFFSQLMSGWPHHDCEEFAKLLIRFTEALPTILVRRLRDQNLVSHRAKGDSK
jgi:DNA-binding MarR family transcriptional regulator